MVIWPEIWVPILYDVIPIHVINDHEHNMTYFPRLLCMRQKLKQNVSYTSKGQTIQRPVSI